MDAAASARRESSDPMLGRRRRCDGVAFTIMLL